MVGGYSVDLITVGSAYRKKRFKSTEPRSPGISKGVRIREPPAAVNRYFQHLKEPLGFMKNPDIEPTVFWPAI